MTLTEEPGLQSVRVLPPGREARAEHLHRHGNLRWGASREQLLEAVEVSGLRGRGGGGFPLARKLRAVATERRPVVVANGCESDPLSRKDELLLSLAPHLVLDGIALAAFAVGAGTAYLCLHEGTAAEASAAAAVAERPDDPVRLVRVPAEFVAGQESALVNFLGTGRPRPTVTPPRPSERGVRGRPTVVSNVETLAQLAVLARLGPEAYRRAATSLFTVTGAVRSPGVYEVPGGRRGEEILHHAGARPGDLQAVLVGGCGGSWLPLPAAANQVLTFEAMQASGRQLGPAALLALPVTRCGLAETARILDYLAGQSARQCGPCMFGLPAVAADLRRLVSGPDPHSARARLQRRLPVIPHRGACAHPDGAVRLATSALQVFGADLSAHLAGRGCLHGRTA